ncbi:MAG: glycosyltransferase family 9 protein [Verrucomicrobiota bacterium]
MKILLIKPSSLGDVVQSLPVLCNLRRHFPKAQIDWLVFKPYGDLLEDHLDIDHILSIRKPRLSLQLWKEDLLPLKAWFQKTSYDVTIDLQGLLRSGILTMLSGAKRKIGLASAREGAQLFYNETVQDTATQAALRYLQVLDHLKIPYDPLLFHLEVGVPLPPLLEGVKDYFVFHPYTRWKTKLWPWRHYQKLARSLAPQPCVLVGNGPYFPCEGENVIDLRQGLDLRTTMSVLKNAQGVVSTDSGPAHLAAALGVRTISLFGATDPLKTAPIGREAYFIQGKVPCAPCLKRVCQNHIQMACMKEISISNIMHELLLK